MTAELDAPDPNPPADPAGVGDVSVLPTEECLELLRKGSVGRIAFVTGGWPIVLPVNYSFDGADVIVRTDPRSQLAAVTRRPVRVALEADEPRPLYQSGWSVLAFGLAEWVADDEELDRLNASAVEPWARGVRTHVIRIALVQVSGRRLRERGRYPNRWT